MTPLSIKELTDLMVKSVTPVSGGNTSKAYKIETTAETYFLKEMDLEPCPDLFKKETNNLASLKKASSLVVPNVIKTGYHDSKQFIVLEWLDKKNPSEQSHATFGAGIAEMHKSKQPYFGFSENNYVGSLIQDNTPRDQWSDFYAECRLIPFATYLHQSALLNNSDMKALENLCSQLKNIFPLETPSLLHGDLWYGNFMLTNTGPAIFDPACYYGHREMDIGMSMLFGGFDEAFYKSYNEVYPLAKNWKERLPYTQLYPLLAHAVFFKGQYVSSVRQILKPFYL